MLQQHSRPVNRRGAEAGCNLVALMVAVTILMAMIAVALPMWSAAMKREKEAEVIFQGGVVPPG